MSAQHFIELSDIHEDSHVISHKRNLTVNQLVKAKASKLLEPSFKRKSHTKHIYLSSQLSKNNSAFAKIKRVTRRDRSEIKLLNPESSSNLLSRVESQEAKKIKESHTLIDVERRLNRLEKFNQLQSTEEYFLVFDKIIQIDTACKGYLKRIRDAFKNIFDKVKDLIEYNSILENKIAEKQSIINRYLIWSNKVKGKRTDQKDCLFTNREFSKGLYSNRNLEECQNLGDKISQITMLEAKEKQEFIEKTANLSQELKESKERVKKYEELINAMKDRGYPIEEIYAKDVMKLTTESSLNNPMVLYSTNCRFDLSSDESELIEQD